MRPDQNHGTATTGTGAVPVCTASGGSADGLLQNLGATTLWYGFKPCDPGNGLQLLTGERAGFPLADGASLYCCADSAPVAYAWALMPENPD